MSKSLITVIIPAYNCSRCITSAIRSVLNQTYGNVELIVVDDGSTDGTADVVSEFDGKAKYVYQTNGGVSKARNTGIRQSNGEYIALLDADDVWDKNKLEIQESLLSRYPDVDMIFSGFNLTKNNKTIAGKTYLDSFNIFKEYKYKVTDIFENNIIVRQNNLDVPFFWGNIYRYLLLGNFILPSSVIFRKDSLLNVGYFNEEYRVAEETEYFLKYSKKCRIGFVEYPLLNYEIPEPDNLSGKKNTEKLIKNALRIQIDSLISNCDLAWGNNYFFRMGVSTTYCRLAYYYLSEFDTIKSRKYAKYGIFTCNTNLYAFAIWFASFIPEMMLKYIVKLKQYNR